MLDPDRQYDNLIDVLDLHFTKRMGTIHTGIPAIVTGYEPGPPPLAEVQPAVDMRLDDGTPFPLPRISHVPIAQPTDGEIGIHIPYKVGSRVWLSFSEADLAVWKQADGAQSHAESSGRFLLTGAVISGGFFSNAELATAPATDRMEVRGRLRACNEPALGATVTISVLDGRPGTAGYVAGTNTVRDDGRTWALPTGYTIPACGMIFGSLRGAGSRPIILPPIPAPMILAQRVVAVVQPGIYDDTYRFRGVDTINAPVANHQFGNRFFDFRLQFGRDAANQLYIGLEGVTLRSGTGDITVFNGLTLEIWEFLT